MSGSVDLEAFANEARISDREQFRARIIERRPEFKINADTTVARLLGIHVIPTLVVNGTMYSGVMSVEEIDAIIQNILQENAD